jgi:hypothetical protein
MFLFTNISDYSDGIEQSLIVLKCFDQTQSPGLTLNGKTL